jgi:mannose-6-phosphate isomerase-like protein (cupin superfamily)
MTTYRLSEHSILTVKSSTKDALEVEAVYQPGSPPPNHWHPAQSEHFEILKGTLRVIYGRADRMLRPGDTVDIPAGMPHQMWNEGEVPTVVSWRTTPPGRTEQWYARIATLNAAGRPGVVDFAVAAREFRDVFQPAIRPRFLSGPAIALLAAIGRTRSWLRALRGLSDTVR